MLVKRKKKLGVTIPNDCDPPADSCKLPISEVIMWIETFSPVFEIEVFLSLFSFCVVDAKPLHRIMVANQA